VFDVPAIIGGLCLFGLAGSLSVAESSIARGRSPKGGIRFLLAGFAIDGVVATVAYWILKVSLVRDFWGEPVSIYVAALVWGPLLLRVKLELLFPLSARAKEVLSTFTTVRSKLLDRVDAGATLNLAIWVRDVACPAIEMKGFEEVALLARTYFRELVRMSEEEKNTVIARVDEIALDSIDEESRESSLAWLVIHHGGKGTLRGILQNSILRASESAIS